MFAVAGSQGADSTTLLASEQLVIYGQAGWLSSIE